MPWSHHPPQHSIVSLPASGHGPKLKLPSVSPQGPSRSYVWWCPGFGGPNCGGKRANFLDADHMGLRNCMYTYTQDGMPRLAGRYRVHSHDVGIPSYPLYPFLIPVRCSMRRFFYGRLI